MDGGDHTSGTSTMTPPPQPPAVPPPEKLVVASSKDFAASTKKQVKRNRYAVACAVLASMTSILLGYDIGVMSGATLYIKRQMHLSDVQVEIASGSINIFSLIGSALAGRTADWIGRRYTIVAAGAIFFAGAILMGLAPNYAFLMLGRFVAGIGVGYAMMIAPVYTAELAPASIRGCLSSFPEVFINTGVLLGYVSNFAFSGLPLHLGWRFMLGIGAVPAVVLALGVLAMPESPRWLVMQGRLGEAKRVLYKTSDSEEEAELRLGAIKEVAGIPEECNEDIVSIPKSSRSHGEGVWRELILSPTPAVRRVMVAALGLHFFQQSSGIDAVVLYSPRIFEKAGITRDTPKLLATIAVGFSKTAFILVATFLLDRVGRRPLLLTSAGGMVVCLTVLGACLTFIDHHMLGAGHGLSWAVGLSIAMVLAFVGSFSIGLGPIAWVYSSEIFPLRLRAQGASMGVAVNRLMSGVISMTFLSLSSAITTGGAFLLFATVATVGWIFFFLFLPETHGRTLEEMDELFSEFRWMQRRPKRKDDAQINGDKVELGGL